MKKLLTLMGAAILTVGMASPLVSCDLNATMIIDFVPSRPGKDVAAATSKMAGILEAKLKKAGFEESVKVVVAKDYNAAGKAVKSGKAKLAFLPVGSYLQCRGSADKPDVGLMLVAARLAMIPDINAATKASSGEDYSYYGLNYDADRRDNQRVSIFNQYNDIVNDDAESWAGNQQMARTALYDGKSQTPYYRSLIYANNNILKTVKNVVHTGEAKEAWENLVNADGRIREISAVDANASKMYSYILTGVIDYMVANKLINRILLSANQTSSAGLIYPLATIEEAYATIGRTDDAKKLVKNLIANHGVQTDYNDAFDKITPVKIDGADSKADISVGYADARTDATIDRTDMMYKNVQTIGVSYGIPNDAINYSTKDFAGDKGYKELTALRQSFKEMIDDQTNKEIFAIYGHRNYLGPEGMENGTTTKAQSDAFEKKYNDSYLKIQSNKYVHDVTSWLNHE